MNIQSMKSNLQMSDLHFPECSIQRGKRVEEGEYHIDLKKEIDQVGEHSFDVTLKTTIEKEDLNISVVAKATFLYEADDYARELSVINVNTVAIMFPFVRSQVTLLTSQPGMAPIVLPAINTAKFCEEEK